jgi:hypothetical protein
MVGGHFFSGPGSSFPGKDTWQDFMTLFHINMPEMLHTGDSNEDVGCIFNAINAAAKIGVEETVILAIIMQESSGNVGVVSTTDQDGQTSAGLMQCRGSPGFDGHHHLSQVGMPVKPFLFLTRSPCLFGTGPNHLNGGGWYAAFQSHPG